MVWRLFSIVALSVGLLGACDCVTLPAKQAKREAEIVFRGAITSFHNSGTGSRIAVFRVSRVWKGKVKETFEMLALQEIYSCMGFLPKLEIGSELIVYAHRLVPSDPELFPIVCNTLLVRDVKDIAELGAGKKPSSR